MTLDPNFGLITWFKNVSPLFFTFRRFYRNLWGVQNFIYIVGYQSESKYNNIINTYIKSTGVVIEKEKRYISSFLSRSFLSNVHKLVALDDKGIRSTFFLYQTSVDSRNPLSDWHKIKKYFYSVLFTDIIDSNAKYICVDDDEFLYSSDMPTLIAKIYDRKICRFHFVESVLHQLFNPSSLQWCWQSWFTNYYSETSFPNYSCSAGKTYSFSPAARTFGRNNPFWIHSGNMHLTSSSCEVFLN